MAYAEAVERSAVDAGAGRDVGLDALAEGERGSNDAPSSRLSSRDGMYLDAEAAFRQVACRAEFSWPCGEVVSVAGCESGFDPNAHNPSGSYGIMQIQAYWHMDKLRRVTGSGDVTLLFDPLVNLAIADIIYRDGGWSAWSCRP